MVLHYTQASPKRGKLQHYLPILEYPWRKVVRGNLSNGQNFKQYTLLLIFLGRKKWSEGWVSSDSCAVASDLAGWAWTWKQHAWKIDEGWGRCMWIDFSEWAKNEKTSVSHVNGHQSMTLERKILIIKQIGWPTLWIPVSLLQPLLWLTNGHTVALVEGIEVMQRLSIMGFHSSRIIWLQPLLSAWSASIEDQLRVPGVTPFPGVIIQLPGGRLITLDDFHHGRDSTLF